MRTFTEDKLVIATHNKGKLGEFQKMLAPLGIAVVSAGDLNLEEPEETGSTFEANARLKAMAAAKASGLPALADDSGLCVEALGGQPGVYSARWCGPEKEPMVGMARIHDELGDSPNRDAYFTACLVLAWPDGHTEMVEGRCNGFIVWPPRGDQGHGYDPFFVPEEGNGRSFGEMAADEKDAISHRGRAIQKIQKLFNAGGE